MNRAHEAKRLRSLRTLAFLMSLGAIDMQVLTDLKSKEVVSACAVRDQASPNYRLSALPWPVGQERLILTCSGSGDPELQGHVARRGTGPRPTVRAGFTVVRGPGPRDA